MKNQIMYLTGITISMVGIGGLILSILINRHFETLFNTIAIAQDQMLKLEHSQLIPNFAVGAFSIFVLIGSAVSIVSIIKAKKK